MDTTISTSESSDAAPPAADTPKRSLEEIKAYHHVKRVCHLSGLGISLLYWLCWLALAGGFVNWVDLQVDARWAALPIAALFMFGLSVVVHLPLDFYSSHIIEQRFNLSNQTPKDWLVFQLKGWLVGVIIGAILLAGLYALLWYAGPLWSVWMWIGVMGFSVLLAKVFPLIILPLFYPATPLDRPTLIDRISAMAAGAGMTVTGVYNLGLSKETKKANAMLAGLGSTRRVYLSDTLLDAFDDRQIAIVFAHELGHHVRRHIFKMIGLAAVISSGLVALLHWRMNPFATGDPAQWQGAIATLAQVGLLMTVYPLIIGPIANAISRHFERQADTQALRLTDDPEAYRGAFEKLTDMNLADPTPPRWEVILFDDHPPMAERIAMADEYRPGEQS
ncbi:MAG TPA: M48 family metallopeptidase [Phycisphaerae bacterium]|nr:M48 family metallopeptidase [Phycisphaerae bacterium]